MTLTACKRISGVIFYTTCLGFGQAWAAPASQLSASALACSRLMLKSSIPKGTSEYRAWLSRNLRSDITQGNWRSVASLQTFSPFRSNAGLYLDGDRLFGSPDGGQAARVIYMARESYRIAFRIDDLELKKYGAQGLSGAGVVIVGSNFLLAPDVALLTHEIQHVLNELGGDRLRLMEVHAKGPALERLRRDIDLFMYASIHRADEVEARIASLVVARGYNAELIYRQLEILIAVQKEILTEMLSSDRLWLQVNTNSLTIVGTRGNIVLQRRGEFRGIADSGNKLISIPQSDELIFPLLRLRLQQLEDLETGIYD